MEKKTLKKEVDAMLVTLAKLNQLQDEILTLVGINTDQSEKVVKAFTQVSECVTNEIGNFITENSQAYIIEIERLSK